MSPLEAAAGRLGPRRVAWTLCLVGALVHVQSLFVGYLSDDFDLMIATSGPLGALLSAPFPAGRGTYFRPVVLLTLRAEEALAAGPVLHHAVNLAAHLATGALVFALARRLSRRLAIAAAASAVVLVHPISVFDVHWISGRTDVFATLFGLASMAAALCAVDAERGAARWAAVSIAALVLGLASKESAACTPIALAALLRLHRATSEDGDAEACLARGRRVLAASATVTVGWLAFLAARFYREPGTVTPSLSRALKAVAVVPVRLVWPNADWEQAQQERAHPVLAAVAVLALALVFAALVHSARRGANVLVPALVLAGAPLLPLLPGGLVPSTRLMYFPLAMLCVGAAGVFASARGTRRATTAGGIVLLAMIVASARAGRRWVDASRRADALCEQVRALRHDAPKLPMVLVSFPYEEDEVPVHGLHLPAAIGTCMAPPGTFAEEEMTVFGPVALMGAPRSPVVRLERRAPSTFELRASEGARFAFDEPLVAGQPLLMPEGSLVATDVRLERDVRGFSLTLGADVLEGALPLYFDGVALRRLPPVSAAP